ncbi:WD repeat protein, partial [Gregarina niphandrodes]
IYNQRDPVYEVSVSPEEERTVVGVRAAHPCMLDLRSEKAVTMFRGLGFGVSCVQWHPRRELIAAGSKTHEVQLWDPRTAESVCSSFDHKGLVVATEWHPTNEFVLATVSNDHLVYLWDLRMNATEHWLPVYTCKIDDLRSVPPLHTRHHTIRTAHSGTNLYGPVGSFQHLLPLSFESGARANQDAADLQCPWCLADADRNTDMGAVSSLGAGMSGTAPSGSSGSSRIHPTCLKWHPTDPSMFVVGDSAGTLSFWRNGSLLTQTAHPTDDWVAQEVTAVTWSKEGTLLTTAVRGNVGGAVCFWNAPPRWGGLTRPGLCAHPAHKKGY